MELKIFAILINISHLSISQKRYKISTVSCTKVLSQTVSGFQFLHHLTDLDESDKLVMSVFLILQIATQRNWGKLYAI